MHTTFQAISVGKEVDLTQCLGGDISRSSSKEKSSQGRKKQQVACCCCCCCPLARLQTYVLDSYGTFSVGKDSIDFFRCILRRERKKGERHISGEVKQTLDLFFPPFPQGRSESAFLISPGLVSARPRNFYFLVSASTRRQRDISYHRLYIQPTREAERQAHCWKLFQKSSISCSLSQEPSVASQKKVIGCYYRYSCYSRPKCQFCSCEKGGLCCCCCCCYFPIPFFSYRYMTVKNTEGQRERERKREKITAEGPESGQKRAWRMRE